MDHQTSIQGAAGSCGRACAGVVIVRGVVSPDHIHMLLSAPQQLSPAKLVRYAIHKGEVVKEAAGGIPRIGEEVLGTAPVGTRVLLRDGGFGG